MVKEWKSLILDWEERAFFHARTEEQLEEIIRKKAKDKGCSIIDAWSYFGVCRRTWLGRWKEYSPIVYPKGTRHLKRRYT